MYQRQVQRVLWIVLAANLTVAVIKLFVGLRAGALSAMADAFHSGLDASANVIGLVGIALASRPPDRNHPYGHRKYEAIAALILGVFLLMASLEVIRGVIERLLLGGQPEVSGPLFLLMLLTLPMNLVISRYEARQGERLRSSILMADALHTRTDVFVTLSVLASLAAVRLGLPWLDPAVALGVVGVILSAGLRILRSTALVLTDSAAVDPAEVERVALSVPGVRAIHRVRSRGTPDETYVDLHLKVDPAMSTEQAHAIATEVEERLKAEIPGVVDAVVHIEPGRLPPSSEWEAMAVRLRNLADGLGLGVHELHGIQTPEGYHIGLHVEIDETLSVEEAHDRVTELERRVREHFPRILSVTTHIEPRAHGPRAAGREIPETLAIAAREAAERIFGPGSCREVRLYPHEAGYDVALICQVAGETPLEEAHRQAEAVEQELRQRHPELQHIIVHVEPAGMSSNTISVSGAGRDDLPGLHP
ncbi:putative cation efflux system protein [Candidatus Thermoflexus japonica]|uniref:Putative cation efflux system protein n=1 Tax=Candidatus Thermoflexus japonica TaxID=2035417 RepID=A0A2H5Y8N5_9CHLR|nr:putative cation efflux system protein [Candidatus Thermoflexus japonica]